MRQLVVPIAALMAVIAALLLGVAIYGGRMMNETALEGQRALINNALDARVVRALAEIKSVAWWDDAVINASDEKKNHEWLAMEFGAYITESYSHDRIIVLDGHDRPTFAYADGARIKAATSVADIAGLSALVSQARGGLKPGGKQHDANFLPPPENKAQLIDWKYGRWAAGITTVGVRPAIVAVMTITPSVDAALLRPDPHLLVSVIHIDNILINELARVAIMPDLSFMKAADARDGRYSLLADDGRKLAELRWSPRQPGNILLHTVVPMIGLGLLVAGLVMAILLVRLIRSTNALAEREAEAQYLAGHDPLTGMPNRRRFEAELQKLGTLDCQDFIPVVACIDLDRFKDINDTLGHHAGDALIREVARRLSSLMRSDDLFMRPGGDELAILRKCQNRDEADLLGTLVTACFASPFPVGGNQIETSASVGLAIAEPGQEASDLLRKADIALYEAKAHGRGCCVIFEPEMGRKVEERRAIEVDLKHAIAEDELSLAYQPIVDAVTGRMTGVEALARWQRQDGTFIPPDVFIAIAEEAGLMGDLGRFVIDRAFCDARLWPQLDTAINVSAAQLRSVTFPEDLRMAASHYGIDPARITLEITETVLLTNDSRTLNVMKSLRRSGFCIALDDFGTGHSSLSYLRDYPFDKLKIDRSFVSGVTTSGQSLSIIESVVALGRSLSLEIIAEGVETEAEMFLMQKAQCTHLQGYFFSRPVTAQTIREFAQTLGLHVSDAPADQRARG